MRHSEEVLARGEQGCAVKFRKIMDEAVRREDDEPSCSMSTSIIMT